VDFPPPEGPTIATLVPGSTENERPSKILTRGRVGYENPTRTLISNTQNDIPFSNLMTPRALDIGFPTNT